MTTLGYIYSRSEVYNDIKESFSLLHRFRFKDSLVQLKKTIKKIRDKVLCNFREFIVISYFRPCKCFTNKVCIFHGDSHPFFRDHYDNREDPSDLWVIKTAMKCQFYHSFEEIKNHPRKSAIAIAFTIYSLALFPNIASGFGLVYLCGDILYRLYRIFD